MQKTPPLDYTEVTQTAAISTQAHGWRAKCLQRLVRLDLPVPETVALPAQTVRQIAAGHPVDVKAILSHFGPMPLLSVRPSPENPDWGGPGTVLNIGMNAKQHARLVETNGREAADANADPSLAMPLQKLEQLRNQDSPAKLFRLMQGDPGRTPDKKGKNW